MTLLLICCSTLAAGPGPALKIAQDDYAATTAKAKADFDAAVKKARADHRDKLVAIQADRTKAGDLDGALAVRGLLAELAEDEPPSPTKYKEVIARDKFSAAVSKIVWSAGPGGWGRNFVFAPDGYVYSPPVKRLTTTWAAVAPGVVVTLGQDGIVDVFLIDPAKGSAKALCVGSAQKPAAKWDADKVK